MYSNALTVCCGSTSRQFARRADAIGRNVEQLRTDDLAGTPDEIVERLGAVRRSRLRARLPPGPRPRGPRPSGADREKVLPQV